MLAWLYGVDKRAFDMYDSHPVTNGDPNGGPSDYRWDKENAPANNNNAVIPVSTLKLDRSGVISYVLPNISRSRRMINIMPRDSHTNTAVERPR
jgi:hypothetical protein